MNNQHRALISLLLLALSWSAIFWINFTASLPIATQLVALPVLLLTTALPAARAFSYD
ncbi:hypothetical protein QWY20_13505 [Alkalimonas sp. MEB108]|uniref:EamA family transporter n=1 Tax=Alkalimonas cellulosilytica TaxID=3058395 RepID=A0ABU7J7H5_9GAMM|nr:hypothetical protein [Alkalimonas sp. MEB108]MEE2002474.1 hypothetical protein [Alkalimonas sp. MEB108]